MRWISSYHVQKTFVGSLFSLSTNYLCYSVWQSNAKGLFSYGSQSVYATEMLDRHETVYRSITKVSKNELVKSPVVLESKKMTRHLPSMGFNLWMTLSMTNVKCSSELFATIFKCVDLSLRIEIQVCGRIVAQQK